MQENEFEKRVQQKMEEFRLRPSDDVWTKVELGLRKKRKRRVVFFIFLLAGLGLLGYSGYLVSTHSNQNIVEQNSTLPSHDLVNESNDKKTKVNDYATDPLIDSDHTTPKGDDDRTPATSIQKDQQEQSVAKQDADKKSGDPDFSGKAVKPSQELRKENKLAVNTDNTGTKNLAGNRKKARPQKQVSQPAQKTKGIIPDKTDADIAVKEKETRKEKETGITEKDIAQNQDQENRLPDTPAESKIAATDSIAIAKTEPENTVPAAAAKNKKQPRINWGIEASVGISDYSKLEFPFANSQKSFDMAYAAPPFSQPGTPPFTPPLEPSSIKPGLAFKVGPVGEMKISRRSSVIFGLQYVYMSSSMQIGNYRDTSIVVTNNTSQSLRVNSIYRGLQLQDFTNHYHFLQLPLSYQWQINKGKKWIPLIWKIGMSPGYLLASNALAYDTAAGGIYYRDKDAFNRFQFNLHTGLAVRIGSDKKMQWTIGPELSVATNKLMKDTYNRKQYLLYGGLSGRLTLARKK